MKSRPKPNARKRHPRICTATIATAVMVLTHAGSFAPSASATTFTTPFGTVQTAPGLSDGTGLTMIGGGLLLLNPGNTYTGDTTLYDGSVAITAATALGNDFGTITIDGQPINGVNFQATRGGGGGNLTVTGGITISRDFFLRGLGSTGDTGALTSVGNNTFAGAISIGTAAQTRLLSTSGTATIGGGTAGAINLGFGQTTQFGGNGNWLLSSVVSGGSTAALQKIGSGSIELTGANTYGGITTLTAGFLRASDQSNLGTNTGNTAITLAGGTLEIRTDAGSFATKGLANTVSASLFVDHALGSSVQNQTVTFRTLALTAGVTTTLNGRDGYGVTFNGMVGGSLAGNQAIANNLNGLVTYNGDFWNQTNSTARTFTLSGNGDSAINGTIQATGAVHNITKSGTGTLTIQSTGTGSSFTGLTNIQGGTLAINSIKALNNAATGAASQINIGNGTTAGALTFIGSGAASDYNVAKTVNLIGTTGGATINANQTGANPIQISAFAVSGSGSKTLTLGGTNTADNRISGVIANGGTAVTSLAKTGPGTWVLSGNNTYGGSTSITNGTLKLNATSPTSNIIASGSGNTIVFNSDATQAAGGVLQYNNATGSATTGTLGALTATAGMGTVKLTSTGGGAANVVFASLAGGSASRVSGVNFDTAGAAGGAVTITGLTATTPTTLPGNGHFYLNGADFAISNASGVLAAPTYGTTPGFVAAGTALSNGNHNLLTGNIAAQTAASITSLKMTTNTLGLAGNLTVNAGAGNDGGILVAGGNIAAISATGTFGVTTGGAGALVFRVNGATDALTLSAPMLSSTSGGFTKNGAGTLILSGPNSQTGATTINEGTVRLLGSGTLSANNQALTVRQGATLDLNGVSTGQAIGAVNGAGTITNGSSALPVTLSVGNNNGTGTFSGLITDGTGGGALSVVKNGSGAQTWSGLNTYTGSTTIGSTGIVTVTTLANGGSASSIGASSNAASNLVFTGASATGATGGISYLGATAVTGTGAATVSTDRLFTLAGNAANSGGRIQSNAANNAALVFSNTGPIAVTGTAAQTLTLGGTSTGDNTFNPKIVDGSQPTSLSKQDAGLWILGNSNNTYTGSTTIVNGMLQANDGSSLSSGGSLVIGTGTAVSSAIFQSTGNFTRALGAGAGQVAFLGTGTATNAGFAASTGKFNVNIGGGSTLTWGAANTFGQSPTQALLLNSTTALGEVNIQNGIDLNGAAREIQVLDNTNAASDFATISGVISGTGSAAGIIKTGAGLLNLNGANTYQGNTEVRVGTINVTSLGGSSGGGSSSVGASGPGAVLLGFNATAGTLDYVGAGGTSDRLIQATGSSGQTTIIRSNGTGALVLSNLVNSSVAVGSTGRQIGLGGENTGPNQVTSILADAGGGPLSVVKNDGGVWLMSQQHTYTGGTTANNGGTLGIAANAIGSVGAVTSGPLGTGTFTLGNASIAAVGADRTIINAVTLNGTSTGFHGDNSLAINSTVTETASTSLNNFLPTGKTLTINGTFTNDATARTATFTGSGDTIINGLITQAGTPNLTIALNATGGGSLKISGTAGPNNYGGATTLTSGTLILDKVGAVGFVSGGTASILNLNGGVLTATSDANGVISNASVVAGNPTITGSSSIDIQGGLTNSGGNRIITNNLAAGKTLTIDGTVNLSNNIAGRTLTITGTGNTVLTGMIQNGGTLGSLNKSGTGTLIVSGTGSTYTGTTGILNGRVILTGGANEHLPIGTALTLGTPATGSAGGILQLGDASGATTQTISSLTVLGTSPTNAIVGGGTAISTLKFNNNTDVNVGISIGSGPFGLGGNEDNLKLVKTGSGNLSLFQTNTYIGGTEVGTMGGVDGGTLTVDAAGTLGNINTPTPLTVYGGTAVLNNDQTITSLSLGAGGPSSTAKVTVNSTLTVNGNITYNALNNPNPATIDGTGGLQLNPLADTFINVGQSTAGSGGALAPDLTISAALLGSSPGPDIHKTGPGTLRLLNNTSTTFNNSFFIDSGTLVLDSDGGSGVLATNASVIVGSGTKLDLGARATETTYFDKLTLQNNSTLVFNCGASGGNPGDTADYLNLGLLALGTAGGPVTSVKVNINGLPGFGTGQYTLLEESGLALATGTSSNPNPFMLGTKPGGFLYTFGAVETFSGSGVYDLILNVVNLAGQFFWKGNVDSNWSSQNWVNMQFGGSAITGIPGIGNDVLFSNNAATNQTNTVVDINMGANSVTFLSTGTAATTVRGKNNTILSIAGGISIQPGAGSVTFGATGTSGLFINVAGSQNWTNNGTGTLTVQNQVFTDTAFGTQILTSTGTGNTVINGNIIDGGNGGSLAISKTSQSTLTLNNANNTYTGGTQIGGGTLEFVKGGLGGGTVEFTGNAILRWLPVNGANNSDISDRLKIDDGTTVTLDTNGNNVTFASPIQPGNPTTGVLTKTGAGTLTLAADNSGGGYSGGTNINQGTLEFASGALSSANVVQGAVTFTGNSTLRWSTFNSDDISSQIAINNGVNATLDTNGNDLTFFNAVQDNSPSTGSLTKAGSGTLTLTSAGALYTGGTNIMGGTLAFASGALPAQGAITFTGNSTLQWLSGNSDDVTSLGGGLKIAAGVTGTIDTSDNSLTFNSTITTGSASAFTKTGIGTLTLAASNAFSNASTGATTVDAGTLIVSGSISGSTSVNVSRGATLVLAGTGNQVSDTAPVRMGGGAATDPATLLLNGPGETLGALTISSNSVIDFGDSNPGGVLKFGPSSGTWTGKLSIWHWNGDPAGGGADQLFFGTNSSGLNATQLSKIEFFSDDGMTSFGVGAAFAAGGLGEVVPVPELGSVASLLGGFGLLLGLRRRRR